jgi:hypothetical protein
MARAATPILVTARGAYLRWRCTRLLREFNHTHEGERDSTRPVSSSDLLRLGLRESKEARSSPVNLTEFTRLLAIITVAISGVDKAHTPAASCCRLGCDGWGYSHSLKHSTGRQTLGKC